MKFNIDNKYKQIGLTAFLVLAASLLFYYAVFHIGNVASGLRYIIGVLAPIIYGAVFAYLLIPIVNFLEIRFFGWIFEKNHVTLQKKGKRVVRWVSVVIALILFLFIIFTIMMLLIPQVIRSIVGLVNSIPEYSKVLDDWLNNDLKDILKQHPDIYESIMNYANQGFEFASESFIPQAESLLGQLTSGISGVIIFAKNFLIGAIISVYLMADKEKFVAKAKMLSYAVFKEDHADHLIRSMRYTHETFGSFISGKLLDSAIIGVLCYIGCSFMEMPYAVLISVVIGVTNVIPFFGPFIGAIPSGFLILLVDPKKALYFLIFILILQQFDGNILGPKILGDSTGLSSFMVILAILLGGGFFGVVGMAVSVPVVAVLRTSMWKQVNVRLKKKELPSEEETYTSIDRINLETRLPMQLLEEKQKVAKERKGIFMILWNAVMKVLRPLYTYLVKIFVFIISRIFYFTTKLIRAIRKNWPKFTVRVKKSFSGLKSNIKQEMDSKRSADIEKKEGKK